MIEKKIWRNIVQNWYFEDRQKYLDFWRNICQWDAPGTRSHANDMMIVLKELLDEKSA